MLRLIIPALALAGMAGGAAAQKPIVIGKGGGGGQTGSGGRPAPLTTPGIGSSPDDIKLTTPFGPTNWEWKVGQPPTLMPRASSHICLLNSVTGNFAGAGERIALYIDNGATGGPRWVLNGTSGQQELKASASCVEQSRMVPAGQLEAKGYSNHMTGSCAPHVVPMPDAAVGRAYFVSGLSGRWRGAGESVAVQMGGMGVKASIRVTGCSGNADGTLMSVSLNGTKPVKYRTLSGITANATQATIAMGFKSDQSDGEFFVDGYRKFLAPVDEAICGIVRISGKFQGYGELAGVVAQKQGDGRMWWVLTLDSQANLAAMNVGVRCLARDQR